ncbi:hypothetical protein [Sphingobacterium hungaricum]|nr:hypothetical protein [Sphingobacterium hungaricum]
MLQVKNLLIICIFIFTSFAAFAQQESGGREDRFSQIENEKIAYIIKQLKLTPAETQKFIPIYNQYSKEIWALNSAKTKTVNSNKSNSNSFNRSSSNDVIEFDAREVEIKKEYRTKYSQVIGSSRASQFFVVEQEFRSMLRQELQNRKDKNK